MLVRKYIHSTGSSVQEICRNLICLAMGSVANLCIIPMQDYLGLDGKARMNKPSTIGINWRWRLTKGQFDKKLQKEIRELTEIYGRLE